MNKYVVLAGLAALLVPAVAISGVWVHSPVVIDNNIATGTVVGARRSTAAWEQISCRRSNNYAICTSRDAAGNQLACSTYDSEKTNAVSSISSSSMIQFVKNANNGDCAWISIYSGSAYLE